MDILMTILNAEQLYLMQKFNVSRSKYCTGTAKRKPAPYDKQKHQYQLRKGFHCLDGPVQSRRNDLAE